MKAQRGRESRAAIDASLGATAHRYPSPGSQKPKFVREANQDYRCNGHENPKNLSIAYPQSIHSDDCQHPKEYTIESFIQ